MQKEKVFLDQLSSCKIKSQNHLNKEEYSENDIGRYLNFEVPHKIIKSNVGSVTINFTKKQSIEQIQSSDEEQGDETDRKMKANYKNFQKQIIQIIRNKIILEKNDFYNQLGYELWKKFMNSKKSTKNLLYIVLGGVDPDKKPQIIKKHGFQKMFKGLNQENLKKGQQNLRMLIISQVQKLNLFNIIAKTRIRRKQQFKNYFQTLLNQIKNQTFNTRIKVRKESQSGGNQSSEIDFYINQVYENA